MVERCKIDTTNTNQNAHFPNIIIWICQTFMYLYNWLFVFIWDTLEDTNLLIRTVDWRTDNIQYSGQRKNDKQCSTKHYTEN
jgi:hypothetical protein